MVEIIPSFQIVNKCLQNTQFGANSGPFTGKKTIDKACSKFFNKKIHRARRPRTVEEGE